MIDSIDAYVPSTQTLDDETKLFVEGLRTRIIGTHGAFELGESLGTGGAEGCVD